MRRRPAARPPALHNPHPAPADAPTKETRAARQGGSPSSRTKELVSCYLTSWWVDKVYMLRYQRHWVLVLQWLLREK